MANENLYNSLKWRSVRARAIARDQNRCTFSRLIGGPCSGRLHAHHIVAVSEGGAEFDVDNLATTCALHHPLWESLRRILVERLTEQPPRCPHQHRTAEGRRICEARMARQRGLVAA